MPQDQRIYRVKVVTTFLCSGVPLNKIPDFRELLEEHAFRLTDRRHMSDIVPFILSQEQAQIKNEITGKPLSIVFDGTSRLGEAVAIIVRFIDPEWSIQQRLIRFRLLAKSLSGEEIAHELISTLPVQYSIASDLVLAAMRDCVSSNGVAMRTLKVIYPSLLDIGCFSHTLDRVGEKFSIPHVNEFTIHWVSLFSHSYKARLLWKEQTGRPICGYCPTRWWSRWEVFNQLLELFGDLEPFLKAKDEFSAATRTKLLGFFADPLKNSFLKVELAAVIDAGKPFVQSMYKLEGDGPIAFECYEIIRTLTAAANMAHYPNVQAVTASIAGGDPAVQQWWVTYATSCIKPALDYYAEHLKADLMSVPLNAFKAARMFSPHKLREVKPDCAALDSLSAFPFFKPLALAAMKDEYPQYLAAAEDITSEYSSLDAMHLPYQLGLMQHEKSFCHNPLQRQLREYSLL